MPPSKSRSVAAALVELHQLGEVDVGRPAGGTPCVDDAPHDLGGAVLLVAGRGRPAREHCAAAVGVGDAGHALRPGNRQVLQVRHRGDAVGDADLRVGQRVVDRRDEVVDRPLELLQERRGDAVRRRRGT